MCTTFIVNAFSVPALPSQAHHTAEGRSEPTDERRPMSDY